jgi:undecaprenyl-diphosphatase
MTPIWLEAVEDITKLAFIVVGLYFAARLYVRRRQPAWKEPLDRRRVVVLWLLALGAVAIKVTEDVLGGESGPIDKAILLFIRAHVPVALTSFFEAVTLSASGRVLTWLTLATTVVLVVARRRFEAALLAGSVVCAAVVVYTVKVLVGRTRPELWDTQWYWGSSFPSGHTLVVAAFATATALILIRLWPAARQAALAMTLMWIVLVACSRLVLGVHWPTDVLAAACVGAAIPLVIGFALELRARG